MLSRVSEPAWAVLSYEAYRGVHSRNEAKYAYDASVRDDSNSNMSVTLERKLGVLNWAVLIHSFRSHELWRPRP
ncbi:hypothetical protein PsYK624_027920 [Phanerochaete sordida]|uniref:Uncharacterized protein n=1 Tax=Phanerochaete sordida TaxID=48140 RepID=A0A9P3L903_9APHY|nr:hypothetical protein PsYK624_027920 [Phanerochaete sordida]